MTSDYILLSDPKLCPGCGHKHRVPINGWCASCRLRLFSRPGDFEQMEQRGLLPHYWAFTVGDGWKHRDHFCVPGAKANRRMVNIKPLPKNYGKNVTPEEVRAQGGKITKEFRQKLLGK